METNKQLGIWMDHSNAVLMEVTEDAIVENIVVSELTQDEKLAGLHKNENFLHKKVQNFQLNYYRKLRDTIKNYRDVLVFGPTNAKNELLNLVKRDHLFENIKILVVPADKMTENEMHSYVKEYFKIHLVD